MYCKTFLLPFIQSTVGAHRKLTLIDEQQSWFIKKKVYICIFCIFIDIPKATKDCIRKRYHLT